MCFHSPAKIWQTKLELKSDWQFRSNKWFIDLGDSIHDEMLNVTLWCSNESFFHSFNTIRTKSLNESHFHCSGLEMFRLKILIINKTKDTHHKYQ